MNQCYYVYILASKKNGTLYIGVTGNLVKRVYEHKEKRVEGFSKKYGVDKLVYFEETQDIYSAMEREKCLKRWKRRWKIDLIEKRNPEWRDLYDAIAGEKWIPAFAGMTKTNDHFSNESQRKSEKTSDVKTLCQRLENASTKVKQ